MSYGKTALLVVGLAAMGVALQYISVAMRPGPRLGQEPTEITRGCTDCRLVFDTLAVLGDVTGPGMIDFETVALSVDDEGRYYVLVQESQVVQVFSAEGQYLRRLGGFGEGPGEFQWPQAMHVDGGGRIILADRILARLTVFGADGSVESTARLGGLAAGFEVFPMPGDSVLLSGHSFEPSIYGLPVHVLAPDGQPVRSFGERGGAIMSRDPYVLERRLALENGGRLWVASKNEYRVELWSITGSRLSTMTMDVDWFDPVETPRDSRQAPRPILASMRQDEGGLLWLKFSVAGDRWQDALARDDGEEYWRVIDEDVYWTTIIDVINPSTGRLEARARVPGGFSNLFGKGETLLARAQVDMEAAAVRIFIIRARLEAQPFE